jgi:hypothetical protein
MSNFHFDLSLKLSQGEVHDFSGEVKKLSGEVENDLRGGAHLDPHTSPQNLAMNITSSCHKENVVKFPPFSFSHFLIVNAFLFLYLLLLFWQTFPPPFLNNRMCFTFDCSFPFTKMIQIRDEPINRYRPIFGVFKIIGNRPIIFYNRLFANIRNFFVFLRKITL